MKTTIHKIVGLLVFVSILLAGCAPATPETIVQTDASPVKEKEVVVTATPAPEDETVTITVTQWHTMEEQFEGPFMKIVEAFEAENPNIKVEVVGIPWSETTGQLTIRAAGGTAPDVALVNGGDPAIFAAMGALEPVEGLVPQETLDSMQWAKAALIDIPSYQGVQYGLTWYVFTFPLIYNKVAMEAAGLDPANPPATWDEFESALVQVGKAGNDLYGLGGDFTQGSWGGRFFYRWLWAYGADVLDSEGNIAFDSPEAIAALEALTKLYRENDHAITFGIGTYDAREVFARDKVAFLNEAAWMRSILRDLSGKGEAYDASWGVAPWPSDYTYISSHAWVIFKQSKHKEEAAKFINFVVSNRDMQELWAEVFGSIPPQQEYQDFELFQDAYYTEFLAGLKNGRGEISHPQGELIASSVAVAVQEALSGVAEPADALKRAANSARLALGQPMQ